MVEKTTALGPGTRAVIWVQGCPLHCPGCISPEWIPFKPAIQMAPQQVVNKLSLEEITGITFSGGEPMEQAGALAEVVYMARKMRDLDVICFTGYRYETLLKKPASSGIPDFLQVVDVLIDGPYVQEKNNSIGLRGSTNQGIIHLSERLIGYPFEKQMRKLELKVENGSLTMVGIPTVKIASALMEVFQNGIDVRSYYERP